MFKPTDLEQLLTVLGSAPQSIVDLDVTDEDWVQELPDLDRVFTLQGFYARGSSLKRLPRLCDSVRFINVSDCTGLAALDRLPTGLTMLEADNTPLSALPADMPALSRLSVRNTGITHLPHLKPGLESLWVERTPLTLVPKLPHGTRTVSIRNSQVERMEPLPDTVEYLAVCGARLSAIPNLPSALNWLDVEGDEHLLRGLKLPRGIYIKFAGGGALTGTM